MWMFFATTLAHAAPCTDLDLVPAAPQVQGQAQTFDVMGATPGATVLLFRDGEDSPCPGPIAPHCLDLDGTSFVAGTVADGFGVASFQVTVPAALDSTNHGWQAVSQDCGPSELEQTTAASPVSCAYDPLDWSVACETGPMGCFLTGWFDTLYPSGMPAFGASLTVEQVRTGLSQANTNNRAALALALSVDADDLAFFGTRVSLGDQVVPSGPYAGFQLREVAVLALASSPVSAELGATAIQALQAHDQCGDAQLVMPGYPVFDPDPGPSDSGVTDSGVVDTDPPSDSAVVDTGAPDSGADPDSGAFGETGATGAAGDSGVDSGVVDTGWGDTGAFDSGTDPTAGGSGAPPETAAPDSGIPTDDSGVISDSGRVDTGIGGGDTADSGG